MVETIPVSSGNDQGELQVTTIRDSWGRFVKGVSGNLKGRPKGSKSMKEFARDWLVSLDDEQKLEFISLLPPELVFRMAEGNPHSTEDVKHTIAPTPIMELGKVDSKQIESPNVDGDPPKS